MIDNEATEQAVGTMLWRKLRTGRE
jgi:asparagine synthetase B (glutamine-hydrolysing)